jgi:transcriptional regulator with XRE-family HTH domain
MKKLGRKLRQLRIERGMTQDDLAKIVGLRKAMIGHIETGRRSPSLCSLSCLAAALNVSYDYLLDMQE